MKISLNWIKEFVDIPRSYSAKQLAELLTLHTCEVEGYEDEKLKYSNVVVGHVLEVKPHPNADRLRIAQVHVGDKTVQIVCGGQNLVKNMTVAVALPGAVVKAGGKEEVEITKAKIRGEESYGMICGEEEIGLPLITPQNGVTIADFSLVLKYFNKNSGKPGALVAETLKMNDIVFDIDNKSLTHRPDLWGHYGMAREFAAFLGKKLKPFIARTLSRKTGKGPQVKIKIEKKEMAARVLGVIIMGIKVEPSPQWLKDRLSKVGMRSVNNIVDVTNYVMHELGHPLHAFDRRTVKNDTFVIRFAKSGETTTTLDHKKRTLSSEDMLVTNGKDILGIGGVMGGLDSEIKNDTTEIIIEEACWNSIYLRKTAQRHGLRSDAAQRFEKSLDPEITGIAFHRAVELILKVYPTAQIAGPDTDVYPKRAKPVAVNLSIEKVQSKIGAPIKDAEIIKHLKALEFGVKKGGKGMLKIEVPTFRATKDINIEDDLVEEVARMYGYEKIKEVLPTLPIKLPRENKERTLKHHARNLLSLGLGFDETLHYSFYGKPEIQKALLPEELHVEIENPLTKDQTHMRISLLPNMLKSVAHNMHVHENFKVYEIGRTYIKKPGEYFPLEEKFICGIIVRPESKKEIFYDALGALQKFLERFPTKGSHVEKSETPASYAHPSKSAIIKINKDDIATVYEMHPEVLKNFDIKGLAVAAFEINFTRLVAAGQKEVAYTSLPRFPGIEIDVSVLVNKQTMVREILRLLRMGDQNLIAGTALIDIFEDKSLGEGKKSLTFRILLQSPDRTLTDAEMKQVQEKIHKNIQAAGFIVRG